MENFGFDIVTSVPGPVKLLGGFILLIFAIWIAIGVVRGRDRDR